MSVSAWTQSEKLKSCFMILSTKCVNYGHQEICGLKGSSVEFPCSYPSHVKVVSMQGWSQKWNHELKPIPLDKLPSYEVRMSYLGSNGNCTMKLANLTTEDASIYYFIYNFRHATGNKTKCNGIPGVKLYVLASPVHIFVEKSIRGQKTLVTDWTVVEGQGIMLTCIRTCAANLNCNPGYIWYKNRQQLNSSQVNSSYLSLHPVRMEDTGSYVCALINTNLFPIPIVLIASVSFGLVIVITVVMLGLKMKKKRRRCAGSIPATPNHNSHIYMTLDINSMSPDYDTLNTVRRSLANGTDYENLPGISSR
uniref:Ig-like domain-containing protein n=1 Tax=Amphiprion percula TaxID=161767 RepID=A0A3P8RMG2_AMPPE